LPSQPFRPYSLAGVEQRVPRDLPSRRAGVSHHRAPANPAFPTVRPCCLFKVCSPR
jgi:hypothetical protein